MDMKSYYPIVDKNNNLFALTVEKTKEAVDILFPSDYLARLGISLEGKNYVRISNPYVIYKLDVQKKQLQTYNNLETYRTGVTNNLRVNCENAINEGFTVKFGDIERFYRCSITDQLAVAQAVAIAEANGSCEIKCEEAGNKPTFIDHDLAACKLVYTKMGQYIIEQRKQYDAKKGLVQELNDADALGKVQWSK